MKTREFGDLLGLRSKPRLYGFEVCVFDLARDGHIEYAQWLHPEESRKQILFFLFLRRIRSSIPEKKESCR